MTDIDSLLDRLATFEPTTLPVLSLYLNTSSDQHGRDDYASFLRKELKAAGKTFPLRSPERVSFERDTTERITTYLGDALRPSSNAAALFACAGADGCFEHVQLDAPMEGHRLYVADRPHLYPLARLSDQWPPYAALMADTNAARLFVFGRGATIRSDQVDGTKVSRSSRARNPEGHDRGAPGTRRGDRCATGESHAGSVSCAPARQRLLGRGARRHRC